MENEEWRPVVSWEGLYEVSDKGRIRSIPRTNCKGVIRKPNVVKGYSRYHLTGDGRSETKLAHRMVCEAFHGPAPEGKNFVLHGPGGSQDNSKENLRWGDASENKADEVRDGTARHLSITHCPQGHEYNDMNTRKNGNHRRCRPCDRERQRVIYWKKRGKLV